MPNPPIPPVPVRAAGAPVRTAVRPQPSSRALVLSTTLTVWSDRRVRDGFVITTAVHAMANVTVLFVFNALGG